MAISIHPSRVGWDADLSLFRSTNRRFQSTHLVWDGTQYCFVHALYLLISIHPSRVGWDVFAVCSSDTFSYFNPPIPCGMGLE